MILHLHCKGDGSKEVCDPCPSSLCDQDSLQSHLSGVASTISDLGCHPAPKQLSPEGKALLATQNSHVCVHPLHL